MKLVLKLLGIGCILAGLTHVFLGLGSDVLLGAHVAPETLADPSLDSQNRFYGATFTLYGMLFLHCTRDLVRYQTVLDITLAFFFFGGLARLISIALHGLPSTVIIALAASELLIPPVIWLWLKKAA